MTAISQNTPRRIRESSPRMVYPVKDASVVYQGAYLGILATEGHVHAFNSAATPDNFAGIALEEKDNSAGADAALYVEVATAGVLEDEPVTGAGDGQLELGNVVYVTDSGTLTLTSTNNTIVGKIIGYNADTTQYDIAFESTYIKN